VWAAQLGVPVEVDLWAAGLADTSKGRQRASPAIPLSEIRPYVIDVGNNGSLSSTGNYFTTEGDVERLLTSYIPEKSKSWSKKRILIYLHGGLNDEASVAKRVIAFRDVMLENEIYPLHVMWESGAMESVTGILQDMISPKNAQAAAAKEWLDKLRDGLYEARDRTIELTAAKPGGALWSEMKQNGALASTRKDETGALQILARHVADLFSKKTKLDPRQWEIHVVGHSAGSIVAAHMLPLLIKSGIPFRSFQLMAPAVRVDMFKKLVYPHVKAGRCPNPTLYVLSETGERDDDVGPYGKSLLYLVSNAFEGRRETPLLGMLKFISMRAEDEARIADADIAMMLEKRVNGLPSLVVAGDAEGEGATCRSDSHGGFDNDKDTLNSVLYRILGGTPKRPFDNRDLQY
jgi:pimeloyl-ACP methyl ester carboxylesterase